MNSLSIQTDHMPSLALIKARGRIDSDTAPEFDQALSKALAEKSKIILNLEGVEFLSSAGLRAMVKAYQAAKKAGGDVRLSCVSGPVEVVLRTVGMMQMLQMYPTDQEAMEGF